MLYTAFVTSDPAARYLVVDFVQGGVIELELDSGLRAELPAEWLPAGAAEGDGFRAEPLPEGGVRFVKDERAARLVRERNKQTLLAFSDEIGSDEHESGGVS